MEPTREHVERAAAALIPFVEAWKLSSRPRRAPGHHRRRHRRPS